MFFINEKNKKEFQHGKEAWIKAEEAASNCSFFRPDDEDEQVSENLVSCYNCVYRRWIPTTFHCLKNE